MGAGELLLTLGLVVVWSLRAWGTRQRHADTLYTPHSSCTCVFMGRAARSHHTCPCKLGRRAVLPVPSAWV